MNKELSLTAFCFNPASNNGEYPFWGKIELLHKLIMYHNHVGPLFDYVPHTRYCLIMHHTLGTV